MREPTSAIEELQAAEAERRLLQTKIAANRQEGRRIHEERMLLKEALTRINLLIRDLGQRVYKEASNTRQPQRTERST